jgi:hypothetical protein
VLHRRPDSASTAIRAMPSPSGSAFFDSLLAGIAEKIADDHRVRRPAWTKRVEPPADRRIGFGTARVSAAAEASTPPQLERRGIDIPTTILWRSRDVDAD